MTTTWETQKIASLLRSAFAPTVGSPRPKSSTPSVNIDVLITFDSQGVSSHPNHISLFHGARAFIASLLETTESSPVDLYTLGSVGMLRKYTSFVDVFATLGSWWMGASGAGDENEEKHPSALVFTNKLTGEAALGTAWKAMTEAHKSQMVWFRYGWITFSRYMVINDLQLEKVKGK
jgi:N-acetylglucosaminylphosphatidylinositol deacetylase